MCLKTVLLDNTFFNLGGLVNYSAWGILEVRSLFKLVEKYKKQRKTITEAFLRFATESGRKSGSVRNYYYQELSELEKNKERRSAVGVDLKNHVRNIQKSFSTLEEKDLIESIDKLVSEKYSVRSACMKLSGGDAGEMLRLQNKYRNIKRKGFVADNVLYMPQRGRNLSDKEITSLFLGLVRLVKRSAADEASRNHKTDGEAAGVGLRRTLVKLANKEKEYENLRGQFEMMKCENEKLSNEIAKLKCKEAEAMSKKLSKLKEFKFAGEGTNMLS